MLQRIQTLWMMIAALSAATFTYVVYPATSDFSVYYTTGAWLAALLIFLNIFLYKYRHVQVWVNVSVIFLLLILIGLRAYEAYASGGIPVSKKDAVWLLPALSIVFVKLANKAIWRDENLVKSADRIR